MSADSGVGRLRRLAASWIRSGIWIAAPPSLIAAYYLRQAHAAPSAWLALGGAVLGSALLTWRSERALKRSLRGISNVLSAYSEGDFSIRARRQEAPIPLLDVLNELNLLGDALRKHRLGELEAWTLLRKVLSEIDVVVLAFDTHGHVKLVNEAAAKALARNATQLVQESAEALGLAELLSGVAPRTIKSFEALNGGTWELRRGAFRLSGTPHTLVVLSDVSGALSEQESEAWRRLIRVMGHEINNSLAPIQSISENLVQTLQRTPREDDFEQDLEAGLSIIARRAAGLGRFMGAYSKLMRLPRPVLGRVPVRAWVERIVGLEQRLRAEVLAGPDAVLLGDADQLDQLLINLLKNAVEASLPSGGVRIHWSIADRMLRLCIDDDGPGVSNTANLFVPFFTTKPEGSGIGLVLARQITEAHGGQLTLSTRDTTGAQAVIKLPLARD
ncbi:MAG TPA: ATP-binding protein [Polyangiaceae bacterium]|nr:ATP-binding protein [Polyangiaceae bacterium]